VPDDPAREVLRAHAAEARGTELLQQVRRITIMYLNIASKMRCERCGLPGNGPRIRSEDRVIGLENKGRRLK